MSVERVPLRLVRRSDAPLAVAGVCAHGPHRVQRLCARLRDRSDDVLVRLRGVVARDRSLAVVICAPTPEGADALPWIDDVTWLGIAAPGLYIPTKRALSVPASLAASAL